MVNGRRQTQIVQPYNISRRENSQEESFPNADLDPDDRDDEKIGPCILVIELKANEAMEIELQNAIGVHASGT